MNPDDLDDDARRFLALYRSLPDGVKEIVLEMVDDLADEDLEVRRAVRQWTQDLRGTKIVGEIAPRSLVEGAFGSSRPARDML